jgi:hypothetical protein
VDEAQQLMGLDWTASPATATVAHPAGGSHTPAPKFERIQISLSLAHRSCLSPLSIPNPIHLRSSSNPSCYVGRSAPLAMAARGARIHHKENEPSGKRQRTAGRQPLATAPQPVVDDPIVFSAREDAENVLNEKMKGKNKMDYKVLYIRFLFLYPHA